MTSQEALKLRNLLKSISTLDRENDGFDMDGLLAASEKFAPANFMKTGRVLFETFTMIFGTDSDSSFVREGLQKRKRASFVKSSKNINIEIDRLTKRYTLRFGLLILVIWVHLFVGFGFGWSWDSIIWICNALSIRNASPILLNTMDWVDLGSKCYHF